MRTALAFFGCMILAGIASAASEPVAVSSEAAKPEVRWNLGKGVWSSSAAAVEVSTAAAAEHARKHDSTRMSGVTMKGGKMMLMMPDDELMPLRNDWTTTDGTRVLMTGQIIAQDGKISRFREGDLILSDGTVKRKKKK